MKLLLLTCFYCTIFSLILAGPSKRQSIPATCFSTIVNGVVTGANCTGCFQYGPSWLENLKTDTDLTNIVLSLGSIVPRGVADFTIATPRVVVLGTDFGSFSHTFDAADLFSQLPNINTNIDAAIVENALRKLMELSDLLGNVCWTVNVNSCDEDIGLYVSFNNQETLINTRINYRDFMSCFAPKPSNDTNGASSQAQTTIDFAGREIKMCIPFLQRYTGNTLCISLGSIKWMRSAISFCPSVSFPVPFGDGASFSYSWNCLSFGQVDPCFAYPTCSECTANSSCGWCPSMRGCLSSNAVLAKCTGCPEGVLTTCPTEEDVDEGLRFQSSNDFDLYDLNHDWLVSKDEWLQQIGKWVPLKEQESTFAAMDVDQDQQINFVEYRDFRVAQDYGGLSAGEIAAIVLCLLLVLVLVGALVGLLIVRKKRPQLYAQIKDKAQFWKRFKRSNQTGAATTK